MLMLKSVLHKDNRVIFHEAFSSTSSFLTNPYIKGAVVVGTPYINNGGCRLDGFATLRYNSFNILKQGSNGFVFCFTIKTTLSSGRDKMIFETGPNFNSNAGAIAIVFSPLLGMSPVPPYGTITFSIKTNEGYRIVHSSITINDGKEHNIVMSLNTITNVVKIFIDGADRTTATGYVGNQWRRYYAPLNVGGRGGNPSGLPMTLGGPTIYGKALSDGECKALSAGVLYNKPTTRKFVDFDFSGQQPVEKVSNNISVNSYKSVVKGGVRCAERSALYNVQTKPTQKIVFGTQFTFEGWQRINSRDNSYPSLAMIYDGSIADYFGGMKQNSLMFAVIQTTTGTQYPQLGGSTGIRKNVRRHVAITFDNGLLKFYLDGSLIATSAQYTMSKNYATAQNQIFLPGGYEKPARCARFAGHYGILTDVQIAQIYNSERNLYIDN